MAATQPKNSQKKRPRGKGKPFKSRDPVTGEIDPRINTKGRPRGFDELRKMTIDIFNEEIKLKLADNKEVAMSQIEAMLREWIYSRDYQKQNRAAEIGFGKVPDEMNVNTFDIKRFIQENIEVFTDGQLTRLRAGESGESILAEVIRDVMQAKTKKR